LLAKWDHHGMAILKRRDIGKIRRLVKSGSLHREAAEVLGVSRSTVSLIMQGKTWIGA